MWVRRGIAGLKRGRCGAERRMLDGAKGRRQKKGGGHRVEGGGQDI